MWIELYGVVVKFMVPCRDILNMGGEYSADPERNTHFTTFRMDVQAVLRGSIPVERCSILRVCLHSLRDGSFSNLGPPLCTPIYYKYISLITLILKTPKKVYVYDT